MKGIMLSLTVPIILCISASVSCVEFEDVLSKVEHYYTISSSNDARLARGNWETFIMLKASTENINTVREQLAASATLLNRYVGTADCSLFAILHAQGDRSDRSYIPVCSEYWKHSMRQRLEHLMNPPHRTTISRSRTRRGLIDAVGDASAWLFGTATQEDVRRVTALVQQTRSENKKIAHNTAELASVVDHTLEELNDTRNGLRHSLAILQRLNNEVQGVMQQNAMREMVHKCEYYVTALLDLSYQLDIAELHHDGIVQDIDDGRVSEVLLPQEVFDVINGESAKLGYVIPDINWLKLFANLTFVAKVSEELIYKVEIPILEETPYILYEFITHPVWVNNTVIQIDARNRILYDTVSQSGAEPTLCYGRGPTICNPVPTVKNTRFTCEFGMITSHEESLNECKMRVRPAPMEAKFEGQYIYLPESTVTLACLGQAPKIKTLADGVYITNTPSQCSLAGNDWKIKGTFLRTKTFHLTEERFSDFVLPPLPQDVLISNEPAHSSNDSELIDLWNELRDRHDGLRHKVQNIEENMDNIVNSNDNSDTWFLNGHDIWQTSVIIICVIILSIVIACTIYNFKAVYFVLFDKPWPYCAAKDSSSTAASVVNTNQDLEVEDQV